MTTVAKKEPMQNTISTCKRIRTHDHRAAVVVHKPYKQTKVANGNEKK